MVKSKEDKAQMNEMIKFCFKTLDTYNKKAEDLPDITKGFIFALEDYSMADISRGFKAYFKTGSKFPAPADIIAIINPPEPQIDKSAYIAATKRLEACKNSVWTIQEDEDEKLVKVYERQAMVIVRGIERSDRGADVTMLENDSKIAAITNQLTSSMKV